MENLNGLLFDHDVAVIVDIMATWFMLLVCELIPLVTVVSDCKFAGQCCQTTAGISIDGDISSKPASLSFWFDTRALMLRSLAELP